MKQDMKKFSAGIHVVVKRNGKYLILKRSPDDQHAPGGWDLPGGGVEIREQPYETALRESKEEAGITIKNIKPLTIFAFAFDNVWSIEILVEAQYQSGKVRLSSEHTEYRWIDKEYIVSLKPVGVHIK